MIERVHTADRLAIIGVSGTGKSEEAKALLRRLLESKQLGGCVAFDPEDEYSREGRKSPHVNLGPLRQRVTFEQLVLDPLGHLCAERVSLAVVPSDDDEEAATQCAEFVELVKHAGNLFVLFDELGPYAGPDCPNRDGQRAINKIATKGRHWGCPAAFVSQRAVHIPASARSQLTQLQSFLQVNPADLAALDELTLDKSFSAKVSQLPKYHSLHWSSTLNKESKP